ncbi:hypothetical protein [Paenibacillus sp. Marseille-Q4541]|uniref:hypothetical protein n=1 Tax=Paenibacillus sp. Marseille-Q4541 TaxID=2831522 RepID=UPI001BAB6A6A|nr:hypothetical protein [Paenibacillus sp. Marseille-Q4541]
MGTSIPRKETEIKGTNRPRTKNSNKETLKAVEETKPLLREKDVSTKKTNQGRPPGSVNKVTEVVAVKETPKPKVVSKKVEPAADPAELSKYEAMILQRAVDEYGLDGVLLIAISRQPWPDRIEDLAKLPPTTLARALYSGYAINPTPAEKVIEELSAQRTSDYNDGMLFVIKAFGLNIPGLPMEEIS